MDEFGLIEKYLAPLTKGFPGAFSLTDDAAVITPKKGHQIVVTKDAITENVHFFKDDRPFDLARKLLRVNLSDIAAMGAKPLCYLIAGIMPRNTKEQWVKEFTEGLAVDQEEFGIHLIGGDTATHNGPLSLSLTMLGEVKNKVLRRNGAKPGDLVYVSGTIGDAALGLKVLQGKVKGIDKQSHDFLTSRYYIPQPRVQLGMKLVGMANSAMDVSDGLVGDLQHIAHASRVNILINSAKVPLSGAAKSFIQAKKASISELITGGDDYELVFTVPAKKTALLEAISRTLKIPLTCIGKVEKGSNSKGLVEVIHPDGRLLRLDKASYKHLIF